MFGTLAHLLIELTSRTHCLLACLMSSSPLKHSYAVRFYHQFHSCKRPLLCLYFHTWKTEIKTGIVYKKRCFKKVHKGLNLELFCVWVLQPTCHHHVEYFFKEEYVDKSESHDCLATSDSQICFGFCGRLC